MAPQLLAPAALLACLCLATSAQARPDPASQLEQVRAGLIEATLGSQSRVQALAFIDSEGRLHEAARFQSDVSVTWKGEAKATPAKDCKPHLRFKRHARLQLVAGRSGTFFSQTDLQVLQARLAPDLMSVLAAETGWHITAAREAAGQSAYEMALTQSPADRAPYLMRVQLDDLGPVEEGRRFPSRPEWLNEPLREWGLLRDTPPTRGRLGLQLSLVDESGETLRSHRVEVEFLREPRSVGVQPDLLLAEPTKARMSLQTLQQSVQSAPNCDPPDYPARRAEDPKRLTLTAGRAAGLSPGDRLLIAPARGWASLALNPGLVSQLAIAEVQAVSDYSAELSVVAGPAPGLSGPLWATPL